MAGREQGAAQVCVTACKHSAIDITVKHLCKYATLDMIASVCVRACVC